MVRFTQYSDPDLYSQLPPAAIAAAKSSIPSVSSEARLGLPGQDDVAARAVGDLLRKMANPMHSSDILGDVGTPSGHGSSASPVWTLAELRDSNIASVVEKLRQHSKFCFC